MSTPLAYGSWPSPISPESLAAKNTRISETALDGENYYWLESRPNEKGRTTLMRRQANGTSESLIASPESVRSKANEYGGGSYCVYQDAIYAVLEKDQQIYQVLPNQLKKITHTPHARYADLAFDHQRQRILAVKESHQSDIIHQLVSIDIKTGAEYLLASGADFYSSPAVSPCASQYLWLSWNHPNMPWDQTHLHLATLNAVGAVESSEELLTTTHPTSRFQPQFAPDGTPIVVSDHSNWWNLYLLDRPNPKPLVALDAEFATPQWVFGMSTYGFLNAQEIIAAYTQNGRWQLVIIQLKTGKLFPIAEHLTDISSIRAANNQAIFIGASSTQSPAVYRYDHRTSDLCKLADTSENPLPAELISIPETMIFPTANGAIAHGLFYPPHNAQYCGLKNELPPLIVMCHGGPTGATEASLNIKIQFWTSRGFAVADINYRGSTGYGREYRDSIKGQWGIAEVDDVCYAVEFLANQQRIDKERAIIRGSSAGGFTVLCALTFRNIFKAGASLYGIGNLATLAEDTHKFESHYCDSLIGPYPQCQALYQQRSPLLHAENLKCPVIFLQGLKDKVVLPEQAEQMVAALSKNNVTHSYLTFSEEGHGFRAADTIAQAQSAELTFYRAIFNIDSNDTNYPLMIHWAKEKSS